MVNVSSLEVWRVCCQSAILILEGEISVLDPQGPAFFNWKQWMIDIETVETSGSFFFSENSCFAWLFPTKKQAQKSEILWLFLGSRPKLSVPSSPIHALRERTSSAYSGMVAGTSESGGSNPKCFVIPEYGIWSPTRLSSLSQNACTCTFCCCSLTYILIIMFIDKDVFLREVICTLRFITDRFGEINSGTLHSTFLSFLYNFHLSSRCKQHHHFPIFINRTYHKEYIQSNSIQGFNQTKPVSHPLKTEILAGARAKQTERLLPITSCEACTFCCDIKFWFECIFFLNRFSNQFQDLKVN